MTGLWLSSITLKPSEHQERPAFIVVNPLLTNAHNYWTLVRVEKFPVDDLQIFDRILEPGP